MGINWRGGLFCSVVAWGVCTPAFAKTSLQEQVQVLRQQMDRQAKEIQQLRKQLSKPSVGYVSGKVLERTLEGSFRMRELSQKKNQLEQKLKRREAQLKAKEAGLLKMRNEIQQQAGMGMMDPKALQKKQMDFQQKAAEFQKEFAKLQKMQYESQDKIRKMQQEFSVILKAKMEPVRQQIEKEQGIPILYGEVFSSFGTAVDLTREHINRYNKEYPWPPPETKQPAKKAKKKK